MCDRQYAGSATPGPRWGVLYAIAIGATGALTAAWAVASPAGGLLACAVGITAGVASIAWIAANRVAFDELEWCPCATSTLRIREIVPRSTVVAPPSPPDAVLAEADDRLATADR